MNEMWRFWGLVILVIVVTIIISIVLIKLFKKNKIVGFTPGLLMLLLSVILFIKGRFFSYSLQDLGYYLMSMICFIAAFATLTVTAIIMNLKKVKNKEKSKKH